MAQVGFFTKKQVGVKAPVKSARKAIVPRQSKTKAEHVLPPALAVRVPAADAKVKKPYQSAAGRPQVELDIECYTNYFLVKFRRQDGSYIEFEMDGNLYDAVLDREGIRAVLAGHEVVTFNGNHFDMPLLAYALQVEGVTCADLKAATDDIIKNELSAHRFADKHKLKAMDYDHVDLISLAAVGTGLKLNGARLHSKRLQDLPYAEDSILTGEQMDAVCEYCGNDLEVTSLLKTDLSEDIDLRRVLGIRYGVDLRSKSDAQIAEEIVKAEVFRRTGVHVRRPKELHSTEFRYQVPEFIEFKDPQLAAVLDILVNNDFTAKPVNNGIVMPEQLKKLEIRLGSQVYRMGMGGLHSAEKSAFHLADSEYGLWDFDVTSYYPSIILQCGLYPHLIGSVFLDIYADVVRERIEAKAAGDKVKADQGKITVNGAFGKLGSPWSILYAPDLMIQVTLTGQLALLMLIDTLVYHGFDVVSGNTDGIVVRARRVDEGVLRRIVARWEICTGLTMEGTEYAGLWSRDVNNYIAIGVDGRAKTKGTFASASRKKNPETDICTDALLTYFRDGMPIEDTIRACTDIRKFISVRQVNGGAVKAGEYLGRVVRWYYSTAETEFIAYKTNGNKVPQTDGARPVMTLPDRLPTDIDYDWYVRKCRGLFY